MRNRLPARRTPPLMAESAEAPRRPAGQIAFPGGAVDDEDDGDLARAALRELEEEIGIPPAAVSIVEQLAMIPQARNVFNVPTFGGVVPPGTPLVVDQNEASAAHRVPLAAIVAPGAVHPGVELRDGLHVKTLLFDYG